MSELNAVLAGVLSGIAIGFGIYPYIVAVAGTQAVSLLQITAAIVAIFVAMANQ